MNLYKLLDHTLLNPTAKTEDYIKLINEANDNGVASICIPPAMVKTANEYMKMNNIKVPICTVVGFPNGYNTTAVKLAETVETMADGAVEIDMVINVAKLKEGNENAVCEEIKALADEVHKNNGLLKVIVETCLLTEAEIRTMCHVCARAGADYIKTSTGFSTGGATHEAVTAMADEIKMCGLNLKIKASGGIKSVTDMLWYAEHGCSRLGMSSGLKMLNSKE